MHFNTALKCMFYTIKLRTLVAPLFYMIYAM